MEYFYDCAEEIKGKMQKYDKRILMFDFDGTLSEIAETPQEAYLKDSTKKLLKKLGEYFYVAVVSGRGLRDIKSKVALPGLIYAGNHGLEWQIGQEIKSIKIPEEYSKKLSLIESSFVALGAKYKGMLLENKIFTLSVHYRMLDRKNSAKFLKEASKILSFIKSDKSFFSVISKKTIDIRPNVGVDKGTFVKFLLEYLEKKDNCSLYSCYVGDDKTDEDVFEFLKEGTTVRMGKSNVSLAGYFVKAGEIDKLLSWFLENR